MISSEFLESNIEKNFSSYESRKKAISDLKAFIKKESTLIDDLIYVSCNPSGTLINNAIDLCRPELLNQKDRDYIKGPHFNLTHAYPVDMFPHTKHCEMVMVFERGGDEVKDDATTATATTTTGGGGGEK